MCIVIQNRFYGAADKREYLFNIVNKHGIKDLIRIDPGISVIEVADALTGLNKTDREACGFGFYLILES